jgi:type II secretory pathway component PulM
MAEVRGAAAVTPPPAAAPSPGARLDDLMLAMDVVDTLRHQDLVVSRELDEDKRDAALIERLRRIYRDQGIEVPDRVLKEGVDALKESRFVYTPPKPGLATRLATLWVRRDRIGRQVLVFAGAAVLGAGVYYAGVIRPEQQRAEQARSDAERLPQALQQSYEAAVQAARVEKGRRQAEQFLADGQSALRTGDRPAASRAVAGLQALRADLNREYTLRIVSAPGVPSGVWRIPARNPGARNYYLIVEPVAPGGEVLSLPVTSEEDRETRTVSRFGVRVSESTFNAVRADKNDDGIIEQNVVGEKRRGALEVDYRLPVLGGTILRW